MSILTPPKLNDQTWDDLRRELVRRIPVHAPEWTNHNGSDPGIALLELFAWLTEATLGRMNRVPENAHREFLKLLQISLRESASSRVLVSFALPKAGITPSVVEFGATTTRTVLAAGKTEFQVEDEVVVLPVEALAVVKMAGPGDADLDEDQKAVLAERLYEVEKLLREHLGEESEEEGAAPDFVTYEATVFEPPEGDELPEAHAIGATVDSSLWIALLAPEPVAKKHDMATVRAELAGQVLSIGVQVDDELCGPDDHESCPNPGSASPGYDVVWQLGTGGFKGDEARVDKARYVRLETESDGTDGLARSGVVRLQLPADAADIGVWTEDSLDEPELFGTGELPPALDDEKITDRILTWIRAFRVEDPQPTVRWIGANSVSTVQAVTAASELLGYGTGESEQSYPLSKSPVLRDSIFVDVKEGSSWILWTRVPDLSVSLPNDPHYVLDAATGTVHFGDGVHGRFPRPGEAIRVRSYRHGGGAIGNVSAATITRIKRTANASAGLSVTNALAAVGGRDGETLEEARARLPQVLRHRERAVAAQDFVDIAMETPSVHVGRAHVLPRHKPHERIDEVPGVVNLIVVPAYDPVHPDEPVPDRDMLRRVCEHLEPRRLVTTELYVSPPEYVPAWVSVAVSVQEGYGVGTVRRWVELAIRQHFAPLPPYGPSGTGWPFGRKIRKADIEAAAVRVEGVELVHAVDLAVEGTDDDGQPVSEPVDEVLMERWQLPVVRGVQVANGETTEAIDLLGDPNSPPADDGVQVPVPVLEESC